LSDKDIEEVRKENLRLSLVELETLSDLIFKEQHYLLFIQNSYRKELDSPTMKSVESRKDYERRFYELHKKLDDLKSIHKMIRHTHKRFFYQQETKMDDDDDDDEKGETK